MEGQNFRARNQIGKQLDRAGLAQAAAQCPRHCSAALKTQKDQIMKVRKFYPRQVLRKFVGKPRVLSTGQEQKETYIIDAPGTRLPPEFTRALNPDLDYSKFNLNPFTWK